MSKHIFLTEHAADPHIVKLLMEHLIAAFEQFIANYPGYVDYVDGFMGVHNFHKAIIEHLVNETGMVIWRDMALSTFQEAIERAKRGGGPPEVV